MRGLRCTLERFQEVLPLKEQAQVRAAMRKGIAWLRKEQRADGSWHAQYGMADTCFALLFLKRANLTRDLTQKLQFLVELRGSK